MEERAEKPVIYSKEFIFDIDGVYEYGVVTFGERQAHQYEESIKNIIKRLNTDYYMYPECRFLKSKSWIYRNIIFESHIIIYRITADRIEVLRMFNSSYCKAANVRTAKKIKI
jgi:plasmid stabilization system protein ParE